MPRFRSSKPSIQVLKYDPADAPHCPHGPTILFERHTDKKTEKDRFFACSASRDRKVCGFYQKLSDREGSTKCQGMQGQSSTALQRSESHGQYMKRAHRFRGLPLTERVLCVGCGSLLMPEEKSQHKTHRLREKVTDIELQHPSTLLQPIVSNKTNAQYLFSGTTVKFITDVVRHLGFRKLLCVGVPRLHEEIQVHQAEWGVSSLLLDLDHRLMQFYGPDRFVRYNMFNHHMFGGEKARRVVRRFLLEDSGPVCLLTDPPFGGMAELLASSVKALSGEWREVNDTDSPDQLMPFLWFFPYFLEHKVTASLPGVTMLDYKVDYENHKKFRNKETGSIGRGSKQGSVVRVFTNIQADRVILPAAEGYRLCRRCARYVSRENRHCDECDACTSKDGSTYTHCAACNRCVKPTKRHCHTCGFCVNPTEDPCHQGNTGSEAAVNQTARHPVTQTDTHTDTQTDTQTQTSRKRRKKANKQTNRKRRKQSLSNGPCLL